MLNPGYLMAFLKLLEERIPPPRGRHHAIYRGEFPKDSDTIVMEGRLVLALSAPGEVKNVYIDEGDFDKPIPQLVEEVAGIVAKMR